MIIIEVREKKIPMSWHIKLLIYSVLCNLVRHHTLLVVIETCSIDPQLCLLSKHHFQWNYINQKMFVCLSRCIKDSLCPSSFCLRWEAFSCFDNMKTGDRCNRWLNWVDLFPISSCFSSTLILPPQHTIINNAVCNRAQEMVAYTFQHIVLNVDVFGQPCGRCCQRGPPPPSFLFLVAAMDCQWRGVAVVSGNEPKKHK